MTELKIWRQSKCSSIEEWIKSGMRMYKHTRTTEWNIIQPLKKKILPFVTTWMDILREKTLTLIKTSITTLIANIHIF